MSKLKALQDDCWDRICPFSGSPSSYRKNKESCLRMNSEKICECCKERDLPDCKIAYPGRGLYDACYGTFGNDRADHQLETKVQSKPVFLYTIAGMVSLIMIIPLIMFAVKRRV